MVGAVGEGRVCIVKEGSEKVMDVRSSGVPGSVVGLGISAVVEAAARAVFVNPMTNGLSRLVRRGSTAEDGRTLINSSSTTSRVSSRCG